MNGNKKGAAVVFSEFKKRKNESDDREKRKQGQAKIKLQYSMSHLAHENKMETELKRGGENKNNITRTKNGNYLWSDVAFSGRRLRYVYMTGKG